MGKQYLNGVLYGTGEIIKFSPEIYSFEEREIGVWTDGKPLYQKSFLIPASTTTGDNTFTTPLGLQNVDKVVDYNAVISPTSGTGVVRFMKLPLSLDTKNISTQNEYSFNLQYYDKATDTLRIDIGSQTSHQGGYGTIWYTKTTDVPGSGHYTTNGGEAHHYSTGEQVVGTWIDGKPLYERTIYTPYSQLESFGTQMKGVLLQRENETLRNVVSAMASTPHHGCCFLGCEAYGREDMSLGYKFGMYYYNAVVSLIGRYYTWETITPDIYATIQYTKTTDTAQTQSNLAQLETQTDTAQTEETQTEQTEDI